MSPGARQWVRWLFNVSWVLLLVLPVVMVQHFSGPDWLLETLGIGFLVAVLVVLASSIAGLFDPDRRVISVVGLVIVGSFLTVVLIVIGAVVDMTAAAFGPHGPVVQLLQGLSTVR